MVILFSSTNYLLGYLYSIINLFQATGPNQGTGYNAPECSKPLAYTLKSDVYSFGVVMLELLTGRMPFDRYVLAFFKVPYLIIHTYFLSIVEMQVHFFLSCCFFLLIKFETKVRTIPRTLGLSSASWYRSFGKDGWSWLVWVVSSSISFPICRHNCFVFAGESHSYSYFLFYIFEFEN